MLNKNDGLIGENLSAIKIRSTEISNKKKHCDFYYNDFSPQKNI